MTVSSGKVRVLIATTAGPFDVVSLERESAEIDESFVVLPTNRFMKWAPMSPAYNAFVSRKTGVIGRLYRHDTFRLTMSGGIDTGFSWQLGILIAHALEAEGQLAERRDAADVIVLATGEIGSGALEVNRVGSVEEKLRVSMTRLQQERAAGRRVVCIWPLDNHDNAAPLIESLQSIGVEFVEADSAAIAFATLGLPKPVLERVMAAKAEQPIWRGSPFRGLEAFDAVHRAVFFGRGQAREEALDRLRNAAARDCAFLLIYGNSGSGKSSLASAGLLGDIAEFSGEVWRRGVITPTVGEEGPVARLASVLAESIPELGLEPTELAGRLRTAPSDVVKTLKAKLAVERAPGRERLVLLVDQLEGLLLWTREQATDFAVADQRLFIEALDALARSGSVWIIATLRSDLLPLLEENTALSRLASDERRYALRAPSRAELREIVQRPIEMAGLQLSGVTAAGLSLSDVLVDAVATNPDSLPLLQFALERLYEIDGRSGTISLATYERMGEIEGAIGRHAEATVADLAKRQGGEQDIDDLLLALGRFDYESNRIIARTARHDSDMDTPGRRHVVEALVAARLLVKASEKGLNGQESAVVRVAHEALLTHWSRAQRLFEERRSALELRERIEGEARAWATRDEDPSYLLQPGSALAAAIQIVQEGRLSLSALAKKFAFTSEDVAQARANVELQQIRAKAAAERRRRQIVAIASIAFLILIMLVGWFYSKIGRIEFAERYFIGRDTAVSCGGFIDARRDEVQLSGWIINLEIVDGKIHMGGSKNEGLLGAHYTITGSFIKPIVRIDPLSALAPGFLRRMFAPQNRSP